MARKLDWVKNNTEVRVKAKGYESVTLDELPPTKRQIKQAKKNKKVSLSAADVFEQRISSEMHGIKDSNRKIKNAKDDAVRLIKKISELKKTIEIEEKRIKIRLDKIKDLRAKKSGLI